MRIPFRRVATVAFALAVPLVIAVAATADARAPDARTIAAAVAWSRDIRDAGPLAATTPVHVAVLMAYRHEDELRRLVRLQGERRSGAYHRYLTSAQWNAYFAIDPVAYRHTLATLERAGFRIDRELPNRGIIAAVAPARTIERFFETRMHRVFDRNGVARYANVTPARIPTELRGAIVAVAGLHSFPIAHVPARETRVASTPGRLAAAVAAAPTSSPRPISTSTPGPNPNPEPTLAGTGKNIGTGPRGTAPYGTFTFANSFDFPIQHGYGGRGRSAGNVVGGDFLDSDLAGFFNQFGYAKTGAVTRVFVSAPFTTDPHGAAAAEATLDVEAILGLAPGANYYEYLIPVLSDDQILFAYERAVSDNLVDALNSSFGGCETDDPAGSYEFDYVAMQGAAKGITFAAASGDNGSQACGFTTAGQPGTSPYATIETPANGYYFTAVGGTTFVATPTGGYGTETGWSFGGGGVSQINPEPDWQKNTSGASATGRNIPDLSFPGDPTLSSLATFQNGATAAGGGTSLASPLFVALQIEIDEVQQARNGWVNPRLYAISAAEPNYAFRDVVAGTNTRYTAAPGYDNVTGIGTPLGWLLVGTE